MKHFKTHIANGHLASKLECEQCKCAEHAILANRTPQNIRDFVRNKGIMLKRNGGKIAWGCGWVFLPLCSPVALNFCLHSRGWVFPPLCYAMDLLSHFKLVFFTRFLLCTLFMLLGTNNFMSTFVYVVKTLLEWGVSRNKIHYLFKIQCVFSMFKIWLS